MKDAAIGVLIILIFVCGYLAVSRFDRLMENVRRSGFFWPHAGKGSQVIFTSDKGFREMKDKTEDMSENSKRNSPVVFMSEESGVYAWSAEKVKSEEEECL